MEFRTFLVCGLVSIAMAAGALAQGESQKSAAQDIGRGALEGPVEWNLPKDLEFSGPLARQKGVVALLNTTQRASGLKQCETRAGGYTADFLKWASFALKPSCLPPDIKRHLQALPMGSLYIAAGTVNGAYVADKRAYKDGFRVRFKKGHYLVEIQDSRLELLLMVQDMTVKHPKKTEKGRAKYARRVMMDFLNARMTRYGSGQMRRVCEFNRKNELLLYWRWQTPSAQEDEKWDCRSAYSNDADRPYSNSVSITTDGQVALVSLLKQYSGSVNTATIANSTSRFSPKSLFHDATPKELFRLKEEKIEQ